jgi:mandelate racemase
MTRGGGGDDVHARGDDALGRAATAASPRAAAAGSFDASAFIAAALARAPALTARAVSVRAVEVPGPPMETAAGSISGAQLALIDLHTDEGVTGHAYVATYTREGLAGVVAAIKALDIDGPVQDLRDALRERFAFSGTAGLLGSVIGGVDMAAWDALARSADMPLAELLGGAVKPVPAYGSLRSRTAQDAEERAGEGFRHLKVKSADPDVIARVKALGVEVMVDLNQQPQDLAKLDDQQLTWLEEPLPAADLIGYAALCKTMRTPIQTGESWWSPAEAAYAIRAGATDLVMPDVARIGGVTGFIEVAAHGLPTSSHMYPEISAHLLAALPNAHLLEHLDKAGPILRQPARVIDGHVTPMPLEFDEAAVARFSV